MFHTHQTSASLFALYVHSLGITLHTLSLLLLILSTLFNSLSFHYSIPAPYLNRAISHAIIDTISNKVLILEPIEAFAYITFLFFLLFHSL